MRWEPAIYEHKASLIQMSPWQVSRSKDLLVEASLAEYETYRSSQLTVGIDVYNVEVEACGASVVDTGPTGCPDIPKPLWNLDALPDCLAMPSIPTVGRFGLLLQAAREIHEYLGEKTRVRVAASGPATIAARLVGLEPLIMGMACKDANTNRVLQFSTELSLQWIHAITHNGFDVAVFDSVSAPPMVSPSMYEAHLQPRHTRLMAALAGHQQRERPLIIGGDTSSIAGALLDTGANYLVCDFPADARSFADAIERATDVTVRRNINPQVIADINNLEHHARDYARDLRHFASPVAGTGILPYDYDPQVYFMFRDIVEKELSEWG